MKNIVLLILLITCCATAQEYTPDSVTLDQAMKKSCACIEKEDSRPAEAKQKISLAAYCKLQGVAVLELNQQLNKATPMTRSTELKIDTESKSYRTNLKLLEKQLEQKCEKYSDSLQFKEEKEYAAMSKNPTALEYYQLGNEAYKQKRFVTAIELYKEAVKEDSSFVYAYDNLGLSYRQAENYTLALEAFKSSLAVNPKGETSLINLGITHAYMENYTQALEAYKNYSTLFPKSGEGYMGEARVYFYFLNDEVAAIQSVARAYRIYIQSNSPRIESSKRLMRTIYEEMHKKGKGRKFFRIIRKNGIEL